MNNVRPCCNSDNVAVGVASALVGVYTEFESVLVLLLLQPVIMMNSVMARKNEYLCFIIFLLDG